MDCLSFTEFSNIQFDSPPVFVSHEGEEAAIIHQNKTISLCDLKSQKLIRIQIQDKSISSFPSKIAINQQNTTVCIAYDDGSIVLFDSQNMKILKSFPKFKKGTIDHMQFINENSILTVSNNQLSLLKISSSLFSVSLKEFPLSRFQSNVVSIQIAPIYENKQIVSQNFQNYFFVTTLQKTSICQLINDSQVKVIAEIPISNSISSVYLANSEIIHIIVETKIVCVVFAFDCKSNQPQEIYRFSLIFSPRFVQFISKNVILLISEENQSIVCNIKTGKRTTFSLTSQKNSILKNALTTIIVYTPRTIQTISCKSFVDVLSAAKNNFDQCITICQNYLKNEFSAGSEQKENEEDKLIDIEQNMKPIFVSHFQNLIHEDGSPENYQKVSDIFLQQCDDLKLYKMPALVSYDIFKEHFNIFIDKLIEKDPNASHYLYPTNFTKNILQNGHNVSKIEEFKRFVLSLKTYDANSLLLFAEQANDFDFLLTLLESKLFSYDNAMKVCFLKKDTEKMINLLYQTASQEKYQSIVAINFILSDHNKYEVMKQIYDFKIRSLIEVLTFIKTCISQIKKPINESQFIHIICSFLLTIEESGEKIAFENEIIQYVCLLIQKETINLTEPSAYYLTQKILNDNEHSKNEDLFIIILSQKGMENLKKYLFSYLYENQMFEKAQKFIQMNLHLYADIITEYAATGKENYIFPLISKLVEFCSPKIDYNKEKHSISLYELHSSSKTMEYEIKEPLPQQFVINSISVSSPLLIQLDVVKFIEIITQFGNISALSFILQNLSQHNDERNYFLHNLYQENPPLFGRLTFSNDTFISYGKYLIAHYPDEVYSFISSNKNSGMQELLNSCQNAKLYEATAYIAKYIGDGEIFLRNFCLCIRESLALSLVKETVEEIGIQARRAKNAIDSLISYFNDQFAVFEVVRAFGLGFYLFSKVIAQNKQIPFLKERKASIYGTFNYFISRLPEQNKFPILEELIKVSFSEDEDAIPELINNVYSIVDTAVSDVTFDSLSTVLQPEVFTKFTEYHQKHAIVVPQ